MAIIPATKLKVIPMPKEVIGESAEGVFGCTAYVPFIKCECECFKAAVGAFTAYVQKAHGVKLTEGDGGTSVVYDSGIEEGAYRIVSDEKGIVLSASGVEGINYALATLLQLISVTSGGPAVPIVTINDKPDCSYRSLMVDLARQWHPFELLSDYVDLCWFYKAKYLHLHFIDTQSYTLPSDVFPKVSTEGRHYTKEQIAQLNEYALARNVELIPEIEVPGHAAAMVKAYPELFACVPMEVKTDDADPTAFKSHFKNNIINVGKPGIMDTLKQLVSEIIEMFPNSKYLHIGGDEATINEWNYCADCTKYMKDNNIDGVRALYTEFTKRMTDMVLSLGRTPIVWEGFPKEGAETISRDVVVIAWESYYHLAPDLLEEGFNIINCSWQPLYIVPSRHWTVENIMAWNIYNWQHWWPKSEARLNPIHVQPTNQVMGGQLCSWECRHDQEIQPIKENLAALSERTWNIKRYADDKEFRIKLDYVLSVADKLVKR